MLENLFEPIMQSIVEIIMNFEIDILEKERQLALVMNELINLAMGVSFKRIERRQRSFYQSQGYTAGKKAEKTVQFLFGPVKIYRTPWVKDGETIYPIDQMLELKSYKRYSRGAMYAVTLASKNSSLRKIAEIFQLCTLIDFSKDTIDKIVHDFGEQAKAQQKYEQEYGEVRQREVPYLFIEADGFMLSTQEKKKKDIAHFVVHEGRKAMYELGSSRLKNDHEIISPTHSQAATCLTDYLYRNYNLKKTTVVINTDGGVGYGPTFMGNLLPEKPQRLEQFIDPYHVQLKLSERVFVPELYPVFKKALYRYDKNKLNIALDTLHSCCETEEQEEHYLKLKAYFNRNWKYLKPYRLRELPKEIGTIGVIESRHRAFTYRMKKQGRYWGKKGMNGMLQIIAAVKNKTVKKIFLNEWQATFSLADRLEGKPLCGLEIANEKNDGITKGRVYLKTDNLFTTNYINYLRK